MKILVFTATYNESDNIKALITEIHDYSQDIDILVVDDCSPDGTGVILDQMALVNSRLRVLHRPKKMGVGSAHRFALLYADSHKYDLLITMDADFSHNPKYINNFVSLIHNYDYVVASRFADGSTIGYIGYRRYLSKLANLLAKKMLGSRISEATSSYRAFSAESIKLLLDRKIDNEGYSYFLACTAILSDSRLKVSEFPFHFEERKAGVSKISKTEIVKAGLCLLKLSILRINGKMHSASCN